MPESAHTDTISRPLRVLIAPLDWGLGHACRCIPLIRHLLHHNIQVVVAAEGAMAELLQTEFPNIELMPLQGYGIRYPRRGRWLIPFLLMRVPKYLTIYLKERKLIERLEKEKRFDAIISDNRPGMFSKKIPCVYITHQLRIFTGWGIVDRLATKGHQYVIGKYDSCWIPDEAGPVNLAGRLSHINGPMKTNTLYIGCLSRFEKKQAKVSYNLLILLSGPEPQRSLLEEKLINQCQNMQMCVAMVRGLPGNKEIPETTSNISLFNHLPAADLNNLISQSEVIVARSGYTTIMDLVAMAKTAILIPTPGQKEQEYLAASLSEKKYFITRTQSSVTLEKDIQVLKTTDIQMPSIGGLKTNIIDGWLNAIGRSRRG